MSLGLKNTFIICRSFSLSNLHTIKRLYIYGASRPKINKKKTGLDSFSALAVHRADIQQFFRLLQEVVEIDDFPSGC